MKEISARGGARADKRIVAAGGIGTVVAALQRFGADDAGVAEQGCAALFNLTPTDVTIQTAIASAGGVEAVVSALRTHGEKNAAVAKFGCAALSNLCQDTDTNAAAIAAAISAGAAPVVQAAMRAHPCEIYLRTVFGPGLLAKLRSGRRRRDEQ